MSRATCCGVQAQEVAAPRADERRQGAASSGEALDRGLISWTPTMAIARIGVLWRGYLGAETLTRFTVPLLLATCDPFAPKLTDVRWGRHHGSDDN